MLVYAGGPVASRYPEVIVQQYGDAGPDVNPHGLTTLEGTWAGVRQLDPPVHAYCLPRLDDGGPPCNANAVVRITPAEAGAAPLEMVVGFPLSELEAIPVGTAVRAQIIAGGWPWGSGFDGRGGFSFEVDRATDGVPLLIATVAITDRLVYRASAPTWTVGPLTITRDEGAVCDTTFQDCARRFIVEALRVTGAGAPLRLAPGETATVATPVGRYRVTHRQILRRIPTEPRVPECADDVPDRYSFEVMRLGD